MCVWLRTICLCLSLSTYVAMIPSGSIRLVDGANRSEGRVEVFLNGQWGTICDDLWSLNNAHVACRQLGFSSALAAFSGGQFPQGEGSIWLDNVNCTGREESLLQCSHNNIGVNNCGHGEDAGVTCNQTGKGRQGSSASYSCVNVNLCMTCVYMLKQCYILYTFLKDVCTSNCTVLHSLTAILWAL